MIQDFFINEVILRKRQEQTQYVDWISKKVYINDDCPIKCRVSHLSYKDLQLLSDTDNVSRNVMKLYANANVEIWMKDLIIWEGKEWTVIAHYQPQDSIKIHHNKYFIKKVE